MILTSTSEPVRFTPPWLEGQPNAPVYLLRAGSVRERGQIEAELAGPLRAGRVWGHEYRAALRDGVVALLAGDPAFDRIMGLLGDDAGERGDDDRELITQVQRIVAEHWPAFRELNAQAERRRELAPIEALRRFLVGVENVDVTVTRGLDGFVSEATLAAIDPIEMLVVGNRAYDLLYGGGDLEKNSGPAASSESGQGTSNRATRRAAGKSKARPGRKTRAFASQAGSSQ